MLIHVVCAGVIRDVPKNSSVDEVLHKYARCRRCCSLYSCLPSSTHCLMLRLTPFWKFLKFHFDHLKTNNLNTVPLALSLIMAGQADWFIA